MRRANALVARFRQVLYEGHSVLLYNLLMKVSLFILPLTINIDVLFNHCRNHSNFQTECAIGIHKKQLPSWSFDCER
jgi:hypothetical protein